MEEQIQKKKSRDSASKPHVQQATSAHILPCLSPASTLVGKDAAPASALPQPLKIPG